MPAWVRSIQPFSVSMAANVTTASFVPSPAVDITKCIILPNGGTNDNTSGATYNAVIGRITYTSSVLIDVTRSSTLGAATLNYTLIEFEASAGTIQHGSMTSSVGTATSTIAAVSTRAFVVHDGVSGALNAQQIASAITGLTLASTLVTSVGPSITTARTVAFTVCDLSSNIVEACQQVSMQTSDPALTVDTVAITGVELGRSLWIDGGLTVGAVGLVSTQGLFTVALTSAAVSWTRVSTGTTVSRTHRGAVVTFTSAAVATTVQRGLVTISSANSTGSSTLATVTTMGFMNSGIIQSRSDSTVGSTGMRLNQIRASIAATVINAVVAATTTGIGSRSLWYEVIQFSTNITPITVFPKWKLQAMGDGVFGDLHPIDSGCSPISRSF